MGGFCSGLDLIRAEDVGRGALDRDDIHGRALLDLVATRPTTLDGALADLVADNSSGDRFGEQQSLIFAEGFGAITDLAAGPGGMYVVSFDGTIYRITTAAVTSSIAGAVVPEPETGALVSFVLAFVYVCGGRSGCSRVRSDTGV